MSYVEGKKVKIPECSLYQLLMRRSRLNASKILAQCNEERLTIKELEKYSLNYAKIMWGMGVREGDIILLDLKPCLEAIILFFALNRIGAVASFLSYSDGIEEIKKRISLYRSKILFLCNGTNLDVADLIEQEPIERVVVLNGISSYIGENGKTIQTWEDFGTVESQSKDEMVEVSNKSIPALIAYTSGTTGDPKAIVFSNENLMSELIYLKKSSGMQYGPRQIALQVVPFNYPYGFLVSTLFPMFAGKTVGLTPNLTQSNISHYLELYRPAYIQAIPTFYKYMINAKEFQNMDLSFIKYAISGGDQCDLNLKRKINLFLRQHGSTSNILDGSGNGEGGGALTISATLFQKYRPESIGRPIYGLSVKFIDEQGEVVKCGETGRFCFAGNNLMMGYYLNSVVIKKPFQKDVNGVEWFITDTYGHMDENKWVYFDGRERRFFVTYDECGSPFKVYCDHVQQVICESEAIAECAVVSHPHAERNLVARAFLVMEKEKQLKEELSELKSFCKMRLQSCAIPLEYVELDSLPTTKAGKIDYKLLEDLQTE